MYFAVEELDEIIYALEGSFPIGMEMAEYLNFIDEMKAQRRIQQEMEDEQLASTLI